MNIFKGLKQLTLESYNRLTDEEKSGSLFFLRDTSNGTTMIAFGKRIYSRMSSQSGVESESKYRLLFEDKFDGGTLNSEYWTKIPINTLSTWQQNKIDDDSAISDKLYETYGIRSLYEFTENGLRLYGVKNEDKDGNPIYSFSSSVPDNTSKFLTCGIWTTGKKDIKFGKVEVIAKYNNAPNSWHAIWLKGENGNGYRIVNFDFISKHPDRKYYVRHYETGSLYEDVTKVEDKVVYVTLNGVETAITDSDGIVLSKNSYTQKGSYYTVDRANNDYNILIYTRYDISEIDLAENHALVNFNNVYTIHSNYLNSTDVVDENRSGVTYINKDEFVKYTCEVLPERIILSVNDNVVNVYEHKLDKDGNEILAEDSDGQKWYQYPFGFEEGNDFKLIIDSQLGSNWLSLDKYPTQLSDFPCYIEIKNVKMYELKGY